MLPGSVVFEIQSLEQHIHKPWCVFGHAMNSESFSRGPRACLERRRGRRVGFIYSSKVRDVRIFKGQSSHITSLSCFQNSFVGSLSHGVFLMRFWKTAHSEPFFEKPLLSVGLFDLRDVRMGDGRRGRCFIHAASV
jgi:hypothetical protein